MRHTTPPRLAALTVAVLALALLTPACDGGSSSSRSSGGGGGDDWMTRLGQGGDVVDALTAEGADAIPILEKALVSSNPTVVSNAAMVTRQLGETAKGLIGHLIAALGKHPGDPFVSQAINAFPTKDVFPFLLGAIQSNDHGMQKEGAHLLFGREWGAQARAAVDPLVAIARDESAPLATRKEAMGALATPLGGQSHDKAQPLFEELAKSSDTKIATHAKRCIKNLESKLNWLKMQEERAAGRR